MLLTLMLLGLSFGALAEERKAGSLSFLNMTEEEDNTIASPLRRPLRMLLRIHGVLVDTGNG